MRRIIALSLMLSGIMAGTPAIACNLASLPFGQSAEEISTQYGLENTGDNEGVGMADIRATRLCKELPPAAVAQLTFVEGKFVRLDITSKQGNGELLKVVERGFGRPKDRPLKGHPDHNNFHNLWAEEGGDVIALYAMQPKQGGLIREYVQITSRTHGKGLDKAMAAHGESGGEGN